MVPEQRVVLGVAEGWVVVNTQPHRERLALDNLERQAFRAYCPKIIKRVRHARRSLDVARPLFPGYLFVHVDLHRWRPIASTLGVRSLVRFGDQPGLINGDFIACLMAREVDGVIRHDAPRYAVGQRVRMAGGAFHGLVATIIEAGEKDRFVLLMELLCRPVKVNVSIRDIAAL